MTKSLWIRLLEAFFRHRLLSLVPVLLLLSVGVRAEMTRTPEYRAEALLYVENDSLLTRLNSPTTQVDAAQVVSRSIAGVLSTDEFVREVTTKADMPEASGSDALALARIRRNIEVAPLDANVVRVRAEAGQPDAALRLVTATVEAYTDRGVERLTAERGLVDRLLQERVTQLRNDVDQSRQALATFLASRPEPTSGLARPMSEQLELTRLSNNLTAAQDRVRDAEIELDRSLLTTEQAKSELAQRLRVADAATMPTAPVRSNRDIAVALAALAFIGAVFSALIVAISAGLDRTVRSVGDLPPSLTILAVVPDIESRR